MKINPTWRPPSPEPRITPSSSATSRETPFQELLDGSGDKGAFGFAELGLFGRSRATVGVASPDRPSPAVEPLADLSSYEVKLAETSADPLPAGISGSDDGAVRTTPPIPTETRPAPRAGAHNDGDAADAPLWRWATTRSPVAPAQPSRGQSSGPARTAALERHLQTTIGAAARVTVVADGMTGSIRIVAASSSLTANEARDLRRLVSRLAASAGLTLSGLTLNGVEVEPSQLD